jgi:hypothetical protein
MRKLILVVLALSSFICAQSTIGSSGGSSTIGSLSPLVLQPQTLPSVIQGSAYPTTLLVATGGHTPYASCDFPVPISVPTGLNLAVVNGASSGCQISGTIAASQGGYGFPVRITDANGVTTATSYSIVVDCSSCGGPVTYSARTDTCENIGDPGCTGGRAVPMNYRGRPADAALIPSVGNLTGKNTVVTDPDFRSRILRASDSTVSSGSMSGPSGGDVGWWAADSSGFVSTNTGTVMFLGYLNTTSFQVTWSTLRTATTGHGDSSHFAHGASIIFSGTPSATTLIMFELDGTLINRVVVDKPTDPGCTAAGTCDRIISRTPIIDLASGGGCLPVGYTPSWQGTFDVSADDQSFTIAFSTTSGPTACSAAATGGNCGQGTGVDIVNYTVGQGCRHYITGSPTSGPSITGDWGCSFPVGGGATSCSGPANAPAIVSDNPDICGSVIPCAIGDQFQIHGVDQTPNPKYAHISKNGSTNCTNGALCSCGTDGACTTYFWDIGTNMVRPCGDPVHGASCGGHQTKGFQYEFRGSGNYKALDYGKPVVNGQLYPGTSIITNLPSDDHGSGNVVDTSKPAPIYLAMTDVPMVTTGYPSAYYGEIIGAKTDVPGTVWRFGHTFNSGAEQFFSPQNNIGVVSPDAKYFFFTSDWGGTLGNIKGGATCNKLTASLGKRLNSTFYALNTTFLNIGAGSSIETVVVAGTTGSSPPTFNQGTQLPQTISSATESGSTATIITSAAHNLKTGDPVWISGVSVAGYNGTTAAFVATVPSAPIASASESGTTVTITTTTPHTFAVGSQVQITGSTVTGYNGTFTITGATSTTFTYTSSKTGLASSTGGAANSTNQYTYTAPSTGLANGTGGTSYAATIDGALIWAFTGLNDCRADVFIMDLQSAN